MAHSSSAEKRIRQAKKHRAHNVSRRSEMRTHIKKVKKALTQEMYHEAMERFRILQAILDRLATRGVIHKNKAARHKSTLNCRLKNLHQKQTVQTA